MPRGIAGGSKSILVVTGKHFPAKAGRREAPRSFELVSTRAFPSGIIFNTYKVVGALKAG